MELKNKEYLDIIGKTLSLEYLGGSNKRMYGAHLTNWRNFPFTVIVYVSSGLYFFEIKDMGRIYVKEGNAVIIPPGIIHKVGMDNDGLLSFAHIHYTIFQNYSLLSLFKTPFIIKEPYCDKIADILDNIYINSNNPDELNIKNIVYAKEQIFLLLHIILDISEQKRNSEIQLKKIKRISSTLKYIENHITDDLSRSNLAQIESLSETRFHYIFKEALGISPMKYVRNLRLNKAQLLLITTDMPISSVAADVGYSDLYHFSKTFKAHFGISPLKYRQGYQKPEFYI